MDGGINTDQEYTSRMDSPTREYTSMEWTDEKHNLYLKSMEVSFVNQLHDSMNFLGWRSRLSNKNSSSHIGCSAPSGQYKVLRDGCWQKMDFERPGFQPNKEDEPGSFMKNPWIQHFRCVTKPEILASPSLQKKSSSGNPAISSIGRKEKMSSSSASATSSKRLKTQHSYSSYQNLSDCNTEVSDQNFVSDETETNTTFSSLEKKRSLITDASSNDQVVPHNKLAEISTATKNCVSATRWKS